MLKLFFWTYVASFLLVWINFSLFVLNSTQKIREKHPEYKGGQTNWIECVFALLQINILALLPVINLVWGIGMVFNSDMICEQIIKNIETKNEL